ncbi:MAG: hypothetical protein AAF773_03795 [Cyanobacteria bacterium P01_D01_bin.115]
MATATITAATVKYAASNPKDYGNGPRINVLTTLPNGEEAKLWGNADDQALLALRKRQSVQLLFDGKGYKLVETQASSPAIAEVPNATAPNKTEVGAYIDQMTGLYAACYRRAQGALDGAPESAIQAAASSVFIATQRKFDLA